MRRWLWLVVLVAFSAGLPGCASSPVALTLPPTIPAPAVASPAPSPLPPTPTLNPQPSLVPTTTPSAAPTQPAATAEPAGCLPTAQQAGRNAQAMLDYADSLLNLNVPFSKRRLERVWNASTQAYLPARDGVLALSVADVQNRYRIQDMLNALHVAGFAAWLRRDPANGLQILAVALEGPAVLKGDWSAYVSSYWQSAASVPPGDDTVQPALKLAPCRWMVDRGLAPNIQPGVLEGATWQQPDFAASAAGYLAPTTADAFEVAFRIHWLNAGKVESPALMCGPLTWAILNDAGAFPPGYGEWSNNPKSFWLPKPSVNGRPWSLFPPETYHVERFSEALGGFDFARYPLYPGDVLYTYSASNGFDHVLVVSETDASGSPYSVTNLVIKAKKEFSIQRVLLYDPRDPTAGIIRNQWAKDLVNGRTGDKGFEVFRWAWRTKDIQREALSYNVQIGDTLPLVAARWRTPPERIAAANGMELSSPLTVGQALLIPPNP